MPELIANNAASTLNGAVDNVVTSWTVTNGSVFPATGNFRVICDSEIALCTARAANVLTVTRGQETTSAASHSNAAPVTHVLTKGGLDAYAVVMSAATTKGDIFAATASSAVTRLAVGADKTALIADSSQATGLGYGPVFAAYTPTWTSSGTAPALGNGVITGRFLQIGKICYASAKLVAGSTSTFGTGAYFFSLPVTGANVDTIGGLCAQTLDASVPSNGLSFAVLASTTTMAAFTDAGVQIGAAAPQTWAVSDILRMVIIYETV